MWRVSLSSRSFRLSLGERAERTREREGERERERARERERERELARA